MIAAIKTMTIQITLEVRRSLPLSKKYCMPWREPDWVYSIVVCLTTSYRKANIFLSVTIVTFFIKVTFSGFFCFTLAFWGSIFCNNAEWLVITHILYMYIVELFPPFHHNFPCSDPRVQVVVGKNNWAVLQPTWANQGPDLHSLLSATTVPKCFRAETSHISQ